MHRRVRPALVYTAAAAVAAFELFVLGLAIRPQVDEVYRTYYITRENNCWHRALPVHKNGTLISFGREGSGLKAYGYLACGWTEPENWGTWIVGRRAEINLKLPATSSDLSVQASIRSLPGRPPGQQVKVFADDLQIATWSASNGSSDVSARIPASVTSDKAVRLTFEIDDPLLPAVNGARPDPNHIRLGVEWIRIGPSRQ